MKRPSLVTLVVALHLLLSACQTPSTPTPTVAPSRTPTATAEIGLLFETRQPPTAAAVLQISPTPLPTATPTPTATPIFYAVQDGDTIWSIAYTNGTIPDEVLALNPAVRPELLTIGQELLLPPPATPIFSSERGTPVPLAVSVLSLQLYETPVGSVWVVGEILNEGAFSAENIQIEITLTDNDAATISQTTAWVVPGIVRAGEKAPFAALLRELPDENLGQILQTASTSVVGGNTTQDLGSRYLDVALLGSDMSIGENGVEITGEMQNTGENSADAVVLVGTLYDGAGKVSGIVQQSFIEPLEPGETRQFELAGSPPGGQVVDYQLSVQGIKAAETEITE